jgi:undecaprenyl-diphosphatase
MLSFNLSLFNFIYHFSHRNILLDGLGIFFAQYLVYFLVLGFLVLAFSQKGLRHKLYVLSEGALAVILARGIITEVIRFFYYHPRPFEALGFTPLIAESGSSFPSGHMTFLFALAMVVWYVNRKWGVFYFILALLVGVARIYVGVHWPLDILGGIVIGIVSAIFVHWILKDSRKQLEGNRGQRLSN